MGGNDSRAETISGNMVYLIDYILLSTCPLVFGHWVLSHKDFSHAKKKELLAKLSKFTKGHLFSVKMTSKDYFG